MEVEPMPCRNRYIVQMMDGRELTLDSDYSLASALGFAGESLSKVRDWFLIGRGLQDSAVKAGIVRLNEKGPQPVKAGGQ